MIDLKTQNPAQTSASAQRRGKGPGSVALIVVVIWAVIGMLSSTDRSSSGSPSQSVAMTSVSAELLGESYNGRTADDGYAWYRITVGMDNVGEGRVEFYGSAFSVTCTDADGDLAFCEPADMSYDELTPAYGQILPAGCSGKVHFASQLPEGAGEIVVAYYGAGSSGESMAAERPGAPG